MALFITLASTTLDGKHNIMERHVGNVIPILTNETVIEIQANGHELHAILDQIEGIPKAFGKKLSEDRYDRQNPGAQRWFGDHARFIAANLQL